MRCNRLIPSPTLGKFRNSLARHVTRAANVLAILACAIGSVASAAAAQGVPNPLVSAAPRVLVLHGVVRSRDLPVARAEVRLLRGESVITDTITDAQGAFQFTTLIPGAGRVVELPPGDYSLETQYRRNLVSQKVSLPSDAVVAVQLGDIARVGGGGLPPTVSPFFVTDRVATGNSGAFQSAFQNARPIEAVDPASGCAILCDLTIGYVPFTPPNLGGVAVEPDIASFVKAMPTATSITIFIHGYNNDFPSALGTAASALPYIAPGSVPVAYSWPSKAEVQGYLEDETSNTWGLEHFKRFLVALLSDPNAPPTVNIIAHSMGNRIAVSALVYLAQAQPLTHAHIGQVVFAAPDVDATTFWEALPSISTVARGVTVYGSTHDEALQASRDLHGYCRAGLIGCNDTVTLPRNTNVIDASFFHCDLIGHGYWSGSSTMLGDLRSLFANGVMTTPTSVRQNLASTAPGRYRFVHSVPNDCAADPH